MTNIIKQLSRVAGRAPAAEPAHDDKNIDGSGYPIPPSRRKKKAIMGWHDPEVGEQLKALATERRKSQQQLLREALNLLFQHYGKDEIA